MNAPTQLPVQMPEESWPRFEDDEIAAVAEVLRSGRVNQWTGERVTAFEVAFERAIGGHAVALANGSVALELCLRALDIGPGDEVIVTSRSFVASASCVALVGAKPIFADVDRKSQNLSPATIMPLIGKRTRAIIPVHLAGWPCNMPSLMALAELNDIVVIEDCAQAIGAMVGGRPVGSYGDAAAFSFCQDKIVTTGGEGGMALFKDKEAYRRAWSYKDHGKDFELARSGGSGMGFRWLHTDIGTNWRLTEMQAAIGLVQLSKLDRWIARRRIYAEIWRDALSDLPILRIPWPDKTIGHAFYKFYAFLVPERIKDGTGRPDILAALNAAGIRAFTGACPEVYLEKAFAGLRAPERPNARELGQTSLMFEVHPTMNEFRLRDRTRKAREIIMSFMAPG